MFGIHNVPAYSPTKVLIVRMVAWNKSIFMGPGCSITSGTVSCALLSYKLGGELQEGLM